MKKEKNLKKEDSKEKDNYEIRKLINLLNIGEIFLIAVPLVRIGLILITILLTMASGDVVNIDEITQDLFAGIKTINIMVDEESLGSLAIFLSCVGYIVNIKIINTIKKIIINFYEDKTPFSEKNIVLLDNLKKCVVFNFITLCLGNVFGMNLLPLIIVLTLISAFKHGIALQQEVDEIL